ncbi:hypothetical protein GCM10009558_062930 [Virgisporangium aurantiacum]
MSLNRNLVRNASWRAASASNADRNAATSSGPRSRVRVGAVYAAAAAGWRCSRNHNRRWPYDGAPSSAPAETPSKATEPEPTSSASRATVPARRKSAIVTATPCVSRTRTRTRVACNDEPPRSAKWSSRPTGPTPSTASHAAARSVSRPGRHGVNGTCDGRRRTRSARNAARSTLPCAVSGSSGSSVTVAGTACAGR